MAQFDVYRNRGQNRAVIPFVVFIQSKLFDPAPRRVVGPLVRLDMFGRIEASSLNPTFSVQNLDVVLQPLEVVSIPTPPPSDFICSLSHEADRIIGAFEELVRRGFG